VNALDECSKWPDKERRGRERKRRNIGWAEEETGERRG
jgi:hypothetical protein